MSVPMRTEPIDVAKTAENLVRCIEGNHDDYGDGTPDYETTGFLILEGVKTVHPIGPVLGDILVEANRIATEEGNDDIAAVFAETLAGFGYDVNDVR